MLHHRRSCRRRPAPSIPPAVLAPADALAVLGAASALVTPGRVAALVLDLAWRPLDLCLCDDDPDVEDRTRILLDLYAGDTAGVVLAHARPQAAGGVAVTPAEARRFARLLAHGDACGAPVLDWFVLVGGCAYSLAELGEHPWRWVAPDLDIDPDAGAP